MADQSTGSDILVVNGDRASLEQIIHVAKGNAKVEISSDEGFRARLEESRRILMDALGKQQPIYGVTTGFGKSCGKRMAVEAAMKNGLNLIRFHGCGTGEPLGLLQVRAAMLARILCFAKGYSGVSIKLLEQMAAFLNHDITPVVPAEGSVGASGDLTPMSYVAAALMGERDVFYKGKRISAETALSDTGLSPYVFEPKEPLAIMNGTAIMTGIAVMVIDKAQHLLDALIFATSLTIHALMGNVHHYHPVIAKAKPHPGQYVITDRIFNLLSNHESHTQLESKSLETLQDPYSIRCAPQIIGVLWDTLHWVREWVEIESNSANDNPIFDPETGDVYMGGNFYGGHIASAMDSLKTALASVADMSDRQISLMVDPNANRGLPADLVRARGEESLFNHGFKAMSISSSALTAEALKMTMPAASFSRSTESHNQDKVSMGTISARDAYRICCLAERVVAIHLLSAAQACEIRGGVSARPNLDDIIGKIRKIVPSIIEDRPMDNDIEKIVEAVSNSDLFDTTAN